MDKFILNPAVEGWLVPGRNPFALYLYRENVDELAWAVKVGFRAIGAGRCQWLAMIKE